MSVDSHIRRGHPIILTIIIIFAIVELGLSGFLTSRFNALHNYTSNAERDRVRYIIFVSTWTLVLSFVYILAFWRRATGWVLTSVASHFIFFFITWTFWLAAAAAITQTLGGGLNCSTEDVFVYCNHLNGLEGIAWIEWILFTFALAFVVFRGFGASRRGEGYRGGLISPVQTV